MITLLVGVVPLLLMWAYNWRLGIIGTIIELLILLLPVEGFHKKEQLGRDIYLLKLKRGVKQDIYYVEVKNNKVIFAYDNSKEYNLNGGAYEETYRKGNIKVYESEKCEAPILKEFITKPSRELFTLAPFSTKREYVFYVPMGTVFNAEEHNNQKTVSTTDVV